MPVAGLDKSFSETADGGATTVSRGYARRMAYELRYEKTIAQGFDLEYSAHRDPSGDREFYAGLARETGGPVLELGCGTGRVLLPIAQLGIACVGLDVSAAMIDVLRSKAPPPNLTLVHASMTDFDLGADRFQLVFSAFRAFQHLYTVEEQLAALARVRRHLAPGGVFAFDMFAPNLAWLARDDEAEQSHTRVRDDGSEIRSHVTFRPDRMTQVMHARFRHERWRDGAFVSEEGAEVGLRWFHHFELEHLLARAGFAVTALFGGFDRRPYDTVGDMVVLAKATP